MKATYRRRHDAHVRTRTHCTQHPDIFEETAAGRRRLAQLDASIGAFTALCDEQMDGLTTVRVAASARRRARARLRARVMAVVRVSRFVELESGGTVWFQPPQMGSDNLLMIEARIILEKVAPLRDLFAEEGLPAKVLKEMAAEIAALERAIAQMARGKQQHVAAKTAIGAALQDGDVAVAALESILRASDDDATEINMRLWHRARRVGHRRARKTGTAKTNAA